MCDIRRKGWESRLTRSVLLCVGLTLCLTACGYQFDQTGNPSNQADGTAIGNASETQEIKQETYIDVDETTISDSVSYPQIAVVEAAGDELFVIDSEGIYLVYARGSYGFMTDSGDEITPIIYQEASPFSEGLSCVCLDGRYGFIDKNGETVLTFRFDYATPFVEGLAYFAIGDTYGFMDKDGEPVFYLDCESVSSFQEGLAYFSLNGKYGYIDQTGKVVIEPVYDDVGYFEGGIAFVRSGGSYGAIDAHGREVIPIVYDSIYKNDCYIMARKDGMEFCYGSDERGGTKFLLSSETVRVTQGAGSVFISFCDGEKWGLADREGTVLLEAKYDNMALCKDREVVVVVEEGEYGLVDFQGKVLLPFGYYDHIAPGTGQAADLLRVKKGGKEGVFDLTDATKQIPTVYDGVSWGGYRNGIYVMSVYQKERGWGLIDREGNLIYPLEYDYVHVYQNGFLALWKNGQVSLLDKDARVIYQSKNCYTISLVGDCFECRYQSLPGVVVHMKSRFLTLEGEWVGEIYEDVGEAFVYLQSNIYTADRWGEKGKAIIKVGRTDDQDPYLGWAVRKNTITPRIEGYYEIFLNQMNKPALEKVLEGSRYGFRLYCIDGCDVPLLYYYSDSYVDLSAVEQRYSSFYTLEDGHAIEIGAALDNVYTDPAGLWYDKAEGRVRLATYWSVEGAYEVQIYSGQNDAFRRETMFSWESAYSEGDFVTKYQVDDQPADMEQYQRVADRYVKLKCLY